MSELTAKQKAFIEELPKNQWNGTRAAIAAGYSARSAGVMACRLLKNPAIAKELDRRTAEIVEKTDVEIGEIVRGLREIAFGGKKATNTEILRALELLGKYKVMFADRHINTDVSLADIAARVASRRRQVESNPLKAIEAAIPAKAVEFESKEDG